MITKGDCLFNVLVELKFVFDEFGREHRAIIHLTDVFGPVDDPKMSLFIHIPRITRLHPTIRGFGFSCRLWILVVLLEYTGASIKHFAIFCDFEFHIRKRGSHGFGPDLTIGLHGNEHSRFSLAVELFQINTKRPIKIKKFGANGFPSRVGHANSTHPKRVFQRPKDQ